jgi:hypothetical protein
MTITARINAALIQYLKAIHKVDAIVAELDEVMADTEGGSCCGGAIYLSFDIRYKTSDKDKHWSYQTIQGDVIDFLPTLDEYSTED